MQKRTKFHKPDREKRGLSVKVHNNNVAKALQKLKRMVQDEGLNQELRRRQSYEKPSEKRIRLKNMAVKRWQRKRREIEENWYK
jgi:small subunit ribosomal protein S21